MPKRSHPLKGSFDPESARWQSVANECGTPGELEVGYADDGMVALRKVDDPEGDLLIYTPAEWKAFKEGVKLGEFDPETWDEK